MKFLLCSIMEKKILDRGNLFHFEFQMNINFIPL